MSTTRRPAARDARGLLELAIEAYGADLAMRLPPRRAGSATGATPPATAASATATPAIGTPATGTPATATPAIGAAPAGEAGAASGREGAIDPAGRLAALAEEMRECRACKLCEGRSQVVFGEGAATADVLFVGEAPGEVEDRTGRPFVGRAGQLLDRILENAMGLSRDAVYIANVNKCRPPGNRDPEPDEVAACLPHLRAQIDAIRPRVIVTLGRIAAWNLLGTSKPMRVLRGRDLSYAGIPVVATWHPAYLLRHPAAKAETWEDVKRVNRLLGRPEIPPQVAARRRGRKP